MGKVSPGTRLSPLSVIHGPLLEDIEWQWQHGASYLPPTVPGIQGKHMAKKEVRPGIPEHGHFSCTYK